MWLGKQARQPDTAIRGPKASQRSALLAAFEAFVLIGGIALAEHANIIDFSRFPVHPFLIAILILAVQYGVAGGVLGAAGATLVRLMSQWPDRGFNEDYFDYVLRAWSEPLLWVTVALVLGVIRSSQIARENRLKESLADSRIEAEILSEHCEQMRARAKRLEHEISLFGDQQAAVQASASSGTLANPVRVLSGERTVFVPRNGLLHPVRIEGEGAIMALNAALEGSDGMIAAHAVVDSVAGETLDDDGESVRGTLVAELNADMLVEMGMVEAFEAEDASHIEIDEESAQISALRAVEGSYGSLPSERMSRRRGARRFKVAAE